MTIDAHEDTESTTITPATQLEIKKAAKHPYGSIRQRMNSAPKRVRDIAMAELAKSNLTHERVTHLLVNRGDDKLIDALCKEYGCSYEETHLVLDYFALVRMMSSDEVGVGPLQL